MDPFEISKKDKPDFSAARQKWDTRAHRANKVQESSAALAGASGAAIGLSGLRGAYYGDYPHKLAAHEAKLASMKPGMKRTLMRHAVKTKPGFPVYLTAAAATGAGFGARHYKRAAEKQAIKYTPKKDRVSKASTKRMRQRARRAAGQAAAHPVAEASTFRRALIPVAAAGGAGALGVYAYKHHKKKDVVKGLGPQPNEASIQQHKKTQGMLGGAAAIGGLTAFGMKGGAKILPKLTHSSEDGMKYAKHLDQTANAVLFGTAGVGGASGLHQASIYHAESKLPKEEKGKAEKPIPTPEVKSQTPVKKGKAKVLVPAAAAGLAAGAYIHHNRKGKPYGSWYDKAKPVTRTRIEAGPAQRMASYPRTPQADMTKEQWEDRLKRDMRVQRMRDRAAEQKRS